MPPKHTPIQSTIITSSLDAKLFQTYARLVMASWRHEFKYTDWLTEDDLTAMIGLDWSNIKRHIGQLKGAGLIAWDTNGKNGKRFSILEVRLDEGAKAQLCAPSSGSSINSDISQTEGPPLPAKAQNCALPPVIASVAKQSPSRGQSPAPRPASDILDQDAWQALREARVGEPARTELSNLPKVTAWYIRAMAAQARREGIATGGLIYRIRNDWPAPDWCEYCGAIDGPHTPTCPSPTQAERRAADAIAEAAERERIARLPQPPAPVSMSAEMIEATRVWEQTLGELQLQLPGPTFTQWLRRTFAVRRENGTLVVGVPNMFALDMLEHRLRPMIERALAGVAGQALEIHFVVTEGARSSDLRTVIEKSGVCLPGD